MYKKLRKTVSTNMTCCKFRTKRKQLKLTLNTLKNKKDIQLECLKLECLKLVAKNEFGESFENSSFLLKNINVSEKSYKFSNNLITAKKKNLPIKDLEAKDQELEIKRIEFLDLYTKAFRKFVDKQLKKELNYDNYKNCNEECSEWLELLSTNKNLDTNSLTGSYIYYIYLDSIQNDISKLNEIKNMLSTNTFSIVDYEFQKETQFDKIKLQLESQRETYDDIVQYLILNVKSEF